MVKDHNENLTTNKEGIIQKFQVHFKNILNIDQEDREESESVIYYTTQPLLKDPNR